MNDGSDFFMPLFYMLISIIETVFTGPEIVHIYGTETCTRSIFNGYVFRSTAKKELKYDPFRIFSPFQDYSIHFSLPKHIFCTIGESGFFMI